MTPPGHREPAEAGTRFVLRSSSSAHRKSRDGAAGETYITFPVDWMRIDQEKFRSTPLGRSRVWGDQVCSSFQEVALLKRPRSPPRRALKRTPVVRAGRCGDGDCAKLFRNGGDLNGVVAGYQSEMQGGAGGIDAGRCTVEIEGKPPPASGRAGDRLG
jgi:hypothetical protein